MRRFVVDTSVTAKLFLDEEDKNIALEIFRQANLDKVILFAPSLMIYELSNALVKAGATIAQTNQALTALYNQIESGNLEIIQPDIELLGQAVEIANIDTKSQGYISVYDASFHALALFEDAIFITADEKYYNKAKEQIDSIILLKNWIKS